MLNVLTSLAIIVCLRRVLRLVDPYAPSHLGCETAAEIEGSAVANTLQLVQTIIGVATRGLISMEAGVECCTQSLHASSAHNPPTARLANEMLSLIHI